MNSHVLRYKVNFLIVVLLLGYTFIHTQLTNLYIDVSLDKAIELSVRFPFGQRLLVPAIANLMFRVLPISVENLFFLLELFFTGLFYFTLVQLLRTEFNARQAQLLSWLFLLLLPLITVINYGLAIGSTANFFYSYDTASLFFMALGFLLCLRAQWYYFIVLVFFATLNRESSFLFIAMIPALHWAKLKSCVKPIFFALITYLLTRYFIFWFLQDMPGQFLEWFYRQSVYSHFEVNFEWLLNNQNILLFIFCFAGLPLFWFVFFDYIPLQYRPLRYVALGYFLSLSLVANFMESRIFGEIVTLLYLPVCVAIRNYLTFSRVNFNEQGVLGYVNRYAVLFILFTVAILRQPINYGVVWLGHQVLHQ